MSATTRQLSPKKKQSKRSARRSQLQPGDMLQERYRIMGMLGAGGFSTVYQARDMRFASVTRLCAIKEMVNNASDPEIRELARRSFETEASILATLQHPSVPDVYDYFSEGDRSYLVMEYIRGKDLERHMEDLSAPPSPEDVVSWALQVCEVLDHLHTRKPQPIVFRDLKPSNIMLDQREKVRLIDFNIAKVFHTGAKGTMIGTEGYSPPEQYRGDASPAGDIYALGATLHHLLTLKDPRMEPPFSWVERPLRELNPEIPANLEAVVNRCLAYNVKERFQDAGALRTALENIQNQWENPQAAAPVANDGTRQLSPDDVSLPVHTPLAQPVPTPLVTPAPTPAVQTTQVTPLWSFKCEDEIRSRIIYASGSIYVGAYDNNLYALSSENGEFQWKYPATDGIGASPCVYKNDIYIGSVDQHLYSINRHNGRLQWRFETGGPIYSSPSAEYDHVFFGSDDGFVYAVNVTNGRMLWQIKSHSPVRSTPLITDEAVYFGTEGGYVYCYDLQAKMKWQFQARRAVTSSPAITEDIIFVGSMDSLVYGIDASSGWAVWRTRTGRPILSSPVVEGDNVYVGSSDGKLYALDVYSGRQIWNFSTQGQVSSSPVVWEGGVYFGSTDGNVYCLDTKKGKLRWKYKTQGYVISSPVVNEGVVYIGSSDHHLYALPA